MIDKAEENRRERLIEEAPLMAFGAALSRYKGKHPPIKAICKEAFEAGNIFLRTSFENAAHNRLSRYEFALHEYKGIEAVRHIAALDGYQDDTIEWLVKRYRDEPDPLIAYAQDDTELKTFGQSLIIMCMDKAA